MSLLLKCWLATVLFFVGVAAFLYSAFIAVGAFPVFISVIFALVATFIIAKFWKDDIEADKAYQEAKDRYFKGMKEILSDLEKDK